jgi:hypothetical protein
LFLSYNAPLKFKLERVPTEVKEEAVIPVPKVVLERTSVPLILMVLVLIPIPELPVEN